MYCAPWYVFLLFLGAGLPLGGLIGYLVGHRRVRRAHVAHRSLAEDLDWQSCQSQMLRDLAQHLFGVCCRNGLRPFEDGDPALGTRRSGAVFFLPNSESERPGEGHVLRVDGERAEVICVGGQHLDPGDEPVRLTPPTVSSKPPPPGVGLA